MFQYVLDVLRSAELDAGAHNRDKVFSRLRELGLDDFGEVLLNMPMNAFPRISSILPKMASDDVQREWTGNYGGVLLRQSCAFVHSVVYHFARLTGKEVKDIMVLDYGCGYGRLARLMYYFLDASNVYGVDPWERSIEECQKAGLGPTFLQSEYLPILLPVRQNFDLAYAFSVFTHLSERATLAALAAVRRSMSPGGVFCITVRPVEYWDLDASAAPPSDRKRLRELHAEKGFAFYPHGLAPIDGEVTYGDTSMSLEWLDRRAAGWRRACIDRSLEDPYQIYVFLTAV